MTETWIIIVAAIGVVYWTVWEAQKFFTSGQNDDDELAYTQKRFLRRLLVSLVFLVILGLLKFRHLADALAPGFILAYYAACLGLTFFLVLLALADLAETSRQLRDVRKNLMETSLAALSKDLKLAAQKQAEQEITPDEQEQQTSPEEAKEPKENEK